MHIRVYCTQRDHLYLLRRVSKVVCVWLHAAPYSLQVLYVCC